MSSIQHIEGKGLTLAQVLQRFPLSLQRLSKEQKVAIKAICRCRTKELGFHSYFCGDCGYEHVVCNSCRNRHCNQCQSLLKAKWLEKKLNELLPVEYYHLVFTLPQELNPLMYSNKKLLYGKFFKIVNETLAQAALNPKNLGGKIGFISILHTWGQKLNFHPHIHVIIWFIAE